MTTQIQLDRRGNMTFKTKTGYNYPNFRCFVSLKIRWNICRLCCKWCQQHGGRRGRKEEVSQWYRFIYCVFGSIRYVRGEICHIHTRMWVVVNSFNGEMWWLGLPCRLSKSLKLPPPLFPLRLLLHYWVKKKSSSAEHLIVKVKVQLQSSGVNRNITLLLIRMKIIFYTRIEVLRRDN